MINAPSTPDFRAPRASDPSVARRRAEAACPYCCGHLSLRDGTVPIPAGFRLERLTHTESSERDGSACGLCVRCHVVFEDVHAVMAIYEQLREQLLLAAGRVRRARLRFDAGRGNVRAALSELAEAFECLRGEPGVRPFSANRLNDWMCGTTLAADQRDCAAFLLHVADADLPWGQRFDVVAAMEHWNPAQRAAFLEWAQSPWWVNV